MKYITIYRIKDGCLHEAMKAVGVSGVELAYLMEVPITTVSRWRSARVHIRRPQAIGLAAVLRAIATPQQWEALTPYLIADKRGVVNG